MERGHPLGCMPALGSAAGGGAGLCLPDTHPICLSVVHTAWGVHMCGVHMCGGRALRP